MLDQNTDYYLREVKNKEGVLGIQFSRSYPERPNGDIWSPGIFVGFILDGYDHKVVSRMKDGLKMCLIISIDKSFHDIYPRLPEYHQLVSELAKKVSENSQSWTHYDHYTEASPRNIWHPLYLEFPMLELFKGTEKAGEQEQRFIEKAEEALAMLLACPAFEKLEEALLRTLEVNEM